MASEALGYSQVHGEKMVELLPGQGGANVQYRSDLDFVFDDKFYRVDFGVTCNSMARYELAKVIKYSKIAAVAAQPFVFIPVIMSTSLHIAPTAETFLKHLARHYQVSTMGQHSNAGTTRIIGDLLAGIAERQLTFYRLMLGEPSVDPQVLFTTSPLQEGPTSSSSVVLGPSAQPCNVRTGPPATPFIEAMFQMLAEEFDEDGDGNGDTDVMEDQAGVTVDEGPEAEGPSDAASSGAGPVEVE